MNKQLKKELKRLLSVVGGDRLKPVVSAEFTQYICNLPVVIGDEYFFCHAFLISRFCMGLQDR